MVEHTFTKTLYGVDQLKKVRYWTIERIGNKYMTRSGIVGGAETVSEPTEVFGKNQNKRNQTSDEEQAQKTAERLIQIRRELGYHDTPEEASKGKSYFQCMLASRWDNIQSKLIIDEDHPVYVQRKLDGCVSGDTVISTNEGDFSIRDIVENGKGTSVISYNTGTGQQEIKPILGRYKNGMDISEKEHKWFKIKLADGREIKLTGNHKVFIPRLKCWRRVDELQVGDELLNLSV